MDKYKSNEVKLPLVVPLVFYNGSQSPYPYTCDIRELFADRELYDRVALGKFNLVDLTVKSDDELVKQKTPFYEGNAMSYAEELLNQGRIEGQQQGMQQAQQQIIKNMISSGFSSQQISQCVGIPIDKLEKILLP